MQSLKSAILHFTSENIEITEEIYKKLSNSIEHIINDFIQHIKDTNSVRDNFKSYTGKYAKIDLLISIQDSHPVLRRIKSLEKLSKLLFNDEGYLLSYFIKNEELAKRPSPHLLHKITFNVKKWSVKDFDILVSDSELRDLKYKVSNIIYKWMFSNPSEYTRAYVVENPRRFGKLQSKSFLQLEYELMQSLTHAVSVHNNKDITDFREVINELRLSITVEKLLTRGKTSASVRNLMRAKTIIISYILDGTLTDQKLKFYDFALNKIDEYLANRHLRLYEKNLISKKGYDKHLWSDDKITAYHVITLLCRDLGFDPLFFEPLDPQIFNADPTSELFNRHHIDVRRKFSVFLLDLILTDTSKHREYDRFIPIKDQKTLIKIIQELIRNDGTGPNKEITSKDIIKTFLSNFNDSKVATFYLENYWQSRDFQEKLRQFNERKRMIKNRNFESFLQIKYSDAYNRFFDDSMQLLNSLNILSDYREFKLSKIFSISDIEYLKRTFNI